jgi:DNA-binding NtrC family response regulator
MPPLAERPADRLAIACALLPTIAARMKLPVPKLDPGAATAIEQASWPGNLRQMRSVLSAVLAAHRQEGPVTRTEVEAGYDRSARMTSPADAGQKAGLGVWLDGALADGSFSMASFEREAYGAAVARADGNLSAAARLLGLTRAQLAYRRRTGNLGA